MKKTMQPGKDNMAFGLADRMKREVEEKHPRGDFRRVALIQRSGAKFNIMGSRKIGLTAALFLFVTAFVGCSKATIKPQEAWRSVNLKIDSDAQLVKPEPNLTYPMKAIKEKVSGFVEVTFVVNKIGKSEKIEIIREEPEGFGFANSVFKLVSEQKYKPAVLNGSRVHQRLKRKFNFRFH